MRARVVAQACRCRVWRGGICCCMLVSGRESNRNQDRSFCGSLVAGMFLYVMYETAVLIHTCVVLAGGNREVEVLEDIST